MLIMQIIIGGAIVAAAIIGVVIYVMTEPPQIAKEDLADKLYEDNHKSVDHDVL